MPDGNAKLRALRKRIEHQQEQISMSLKTRARDYYWLQHGKMVAYTHVNEMIDVLLDADGDSNTCRSVEC